MANMQFTNNAATILQSGINSSVTTMTVATGTGALFPTLTGSQYFYCTLTNAAGTQIEIVKVTARTSDTMTIRDVRQDRIRFIRENAEKTTLVSLK